MHELSLAEGMLDIARDELARHGCRRLRRLRVEVGAISGVVVDSLVFGFETLVAGTEHEGARLDVVRVPLRLRCGICGTEFDGEDVAGSLTPCPSCGEVFGHGVLAGKELRVTWIEGAWRRPALACCVPEWGGLWKSLWCAMCSRPMRSWPAWCAGA